MNKKYKLILEQTLKKQFLTETYNGYKNYLKVLDLFVKHLQKKGIEPTRDYIEAFTKKYIDGGKKIDTSPLNQLSYMNGKLAGAKLRFLSDNPREVLSGAQDPQINIDHGKFFRAQQLYGNPNNITKNPDLEDNVMNKILKAKFNNKNLSATDALNQTPARDQYLSINPLLNLDNFKG